MELRQLATFRTVAEDLSFTGAADKLHLAQSSVSAQIKALEEDLGVRLFDRIGRRIVLTDAGERLLHYARRMQEMADEVRAEVTGRTSLAGSLTIRMPETLAAHYMPEVIERFHTIHPDVEVLFINCDDRRLREELNSGRIDLAFLLTDMLHFGNVTTTLLGIAPLALVVSPDHPLAARPRIGSTELAGQTMLYLRVD